MVRNDRFSIEKAIYAGFIFKTSESYKRLPQILSLTALSSQCYYFWTLSSKLAHSPAHLLFAKIDDFTEFQHF